MADKLRKLIICDPKKCNGCQICEYVCSIFKEKTINWKKSRIRAVRIEPIFAMAIACRKCEEPTCVNACPRDAIEMDDATGVIKIDKNKCNGCGWCIEACEFGAIRLHLDDKIVFTCDFCQDEGGPKCVEFCPTEALKYETLEQVGVESSKKAVKGILEELVDVSKKS